jgi:hypothetical protein
MKLLKPLTAMAAWLLSGLVLATPATENTGQAIIDADQHPEN